MKSLKINSNCNLLFKCDMKKNKLINYKLSIQNVHFSVKVVL